VARALIVGCGCRGRELGAALAGRGWQVRGTSRGNSLEPIEAAGIEPAQADPERPGTVLDLCGDVSVVVWLLGSAAGEADLVEAIHGPRLERLLEKLVDSPVRGFAYEAAGSVEPRLLDEGGRITRAAGKRWRIPVALLTEDRESEGWAERTAERVAGLLAGGGGVAGAGAGPG
jgi:nucleoside-diphosphate-sugar epimerase